MVNSKWEDDVFDSSREFKLEVYKYPAAEITVAGPSSKSNKTFRTAFRYDQAVITDILVKSKGSLEKWPKDKTKNNTDCKQDKGRSQ